MPARATAPRRLPIYALLTANTLSFVAEGIAIVAIPWFVLELTGSYAQMGIVGFFTFLPRVIAVFIGGQVVDRIGFRRASVAADVLSGISVCAIPILFASGHLTFTWLVVVVIVGAVFDGPGATAKEAMVPELAGMAGMHLDRVNAMFQASRRLSGLIGPVVAGALVPLVGSSDVLWANAVVFGLSALIGMTLVPRIAVPKDEAEAPTSFLANTLFGFRFLRGQPLLLWLACLICLTNFLEAPFATVQLPALVNEHYGGADRVGALIGAFGVGAVGGTFVFGAVAPRLRRRMTFIVCFSLIGLGGLALSTVPPFAVAMAVMVMMGIVAAPLNPILMSIRQERVPAAYRARVFGTTTAIAFIAIPLGQLVGGFLIDGIGVRSFMVMVSVIHISVVASFFLLPVLHEMDAPS